MHGYRTAFLLSAGILATGAAALLIKAGPDDLPTPDGAVPAG